MKTRIEEIAEFARKVKELQLGYEMLDTATPEKRSAVVEQVLPLLGDIVAGVCLAIAAPAEESNVIRWPRENALVFALVAPGADGAPYTHTVRYRNCDDSDGLAGIAMNCILADILFDQAEFMARGKGWGLRSTLRDEKQPVGE